MSPKRTKKSSKTTKASKAVKSTKSTQTKSLKKTTKSKISENENKNNLLLNTFSRYGEIYYPENIEKDVEDLVGLEEEIGYMESFMKILQDFKLNEEDFFPFPIKLSMLLIGIPGTGKTTLTLALAKKYKIPVLVVFSNTLITSLLGESLERIKRLLRSAEDYTRSHGPMILFFDEIDAISSERSSQHEVGEIKRTVISFLQELDRVMEKKIPLGIVGATNHPQQLDRAVWRRFTYKLEFNPPTKELFLELMQIYKNKIDKNGNFTFAIDIPSVIDHIAGCTAADIDRAFQVSILYSFQDGSKTITDNIFFRALDLVKGEVDYTKYLVEPGKNAEKTEPNHPKEMISEPSKDDYNFTWD